MDSLDDLTPDQLAALFEVDSPSCDQISSERPTKQLKSTTTQEKNVGRVSKGRKRASEVSAHTSSTHDHVIAERKRREKLSQQFIALSAMVPGLKKLDKASVLGDCMKYVEHLQARVKTLEEQTSTKTMESAVFVNKIQVTSDTDSSSTDEISSDFSYQPLPEIQARISDKNVMIRIHCEKHKGILAQALVETESLNLSVSSSSVMPFDNSTFDITVMAQKDAEFNMTANDLVKKLHAAVVQFTRNNLPLD
ncbi:hypothetical protein ACHQM5_022842 [Ranunculus cassubicifolius]